MKLVSLIFRFMAIIAAASGAMAGIEASRFLMEHGA